MYPRHLHNNRHIPDNVAAIPHESKQLVEVILLHGELMHDIEATIHQLEKNRKAEEPPLIDGEAADNYLLLRHIDTAVNQTVARCQAYLLLPSPYVHRISTDHVGRWEEKSIFLALPVDWPPHLVDPLRDAIHNYIVYRATQLFLVMADEKAAEKADYMASLYHGDINAHLNSRYGPTPIGPTPFG